MGYSGAVRTALLGIVVVIVAGGCASRRPAASAPAPRGGAQELVVTAHAYTSSVAETDATPALSASGAQLRPGMRAIAVSPDLLARGLAYGTKVEVEDLGVWVVLDRMGDAHRRSIDLYMGDDREAALRFGKRRLRIRWGDR